MSSVSCYYYYRPKTGLVPKHVNNTSHNLDYITWLCPGLNV